MYTITKHLFPSKYKKNVMLRSDSNELLYPYRLVTTHLENML
jgi:hypothetical protein